MQKDLSFPKLRGHFLQTLPKEAGEKKNIISQLLLRGCLWMSNIQAMIICQAKS